MASATARKVRRHNQRLLDKRSDEDKLIDVARRYLRRVLLIGQASLKKKISQIVAMLAAARQLELGSMQCDICASLPSITGLPPSLPFSSSSHAAHASNGTSEMGGHAVLEDDKTWTYFCSSCWRLALLPAAEVQISSEYVARAIVTRIGRPDLKLKTEEKKLAIFDPEAAWQLNVAEHRTTGREILLQAGEVVYGDEKQQREKKAADEFVHSEFPLVPVQEPVCFHCKTVRAHLLLFWMPYLISWGG